MRAALILWSILLSTSVWSVSHVARIVKIENDSTVFIPSEGKSDKDQKLVKYLEQTFKIVPAVRGMKLENGYVVTTGPKSKLKMVFNNGDHFFISPNTQYQINWKKQSLKEDAPTTMNLLKGVVRGLIEKDGPRAGMKIETKMAVMGVRGTDFQVSQKNSGLTQISVLRGSVEVKSDKKENLRVDAGQTLLKMNENVQLSKITKSELKTMVEDIKYPPQPQDKEIKELEEKAVTITLKDIKTYRPELYEQMTEKDKVSSEALASTTAEVLEKTAPEKRKKAQWEDLIDSRNPYETYKPKTDEE